MRRIGTSRMFYGLVVVMFLVACNKQASFIIEGEMSDHSCDGTKIFLVPADGPQTHFTVDSVVIQDGKFRFEGVKEQAAILRVEFMHRLENQDLLVITEPGIIHAYMNRSGSVVGTPQNDTLQVWKTAHDRRSTLVAVYRNKWKTTHQSADSLRYRAIGDSLTHDEIQSTFKLLERSEANTLSHFLYKNFKSLFTENQQKRLAAKFKN